MPGEIRKLNALRGLAALVVLVAHFSGATGWLGDYPGRGAGQLGVMLFFVLSGFLMGHLYLDRRFDRAALRRYVVARFARVVPLFAVVIAASIVLPRLGVTGVFYDLPTPQLIASHLTTLSGKSILWTIPTELHFYAAFVVLWLIFARSKRAGTLLAVGLIVAVVAADFPRFRGETVRMIPYDLRLAQVVPYFLAGVLLARLYHNPDTRRWQHPAFASVLLVIPLMYPSIFEELFGYRHGLWNDVLVLVVVAGVFAVVLFAVPDTPGVLVNRLGDELGRISYSLYLLHVPVMWLVRQVEVPNTIGFVVFLGLSLLVASAAFRLFELPMQRMLRSRLLG